MGRRGRRRPHEVAAPERRRRLRFGAEKPGAVTKGPPIALGLTVAALAIVFTLSDNIVGVFFLLPVALVAWFVFIRPTHRKRYRAAIAQLPRWDLRAGGPAP